MTPSRLCVLLLALVCTNAGLTSVPTDDNLVMKTITANNVISNKHTMSNKHNKAIRKNVVVNSVIVNNDNNRKSNVISNVIHNDIDRENIITKSNIINNDFYKPNKELETRTKVNNNALINYIKPDNNVNSEEITNYRYKEISLNKYSRFMNERMREFNGVEVEDEKKRDKRDLELDPCTKFVDKDRKLTHPHTSDSKNYANNVTCFTVIKAADGQIIKLTFVDFFQIEEGPEGTCPYDYLEIRDGSKGYAKLLKKVCGHTFPSQITSSGPYLWLKFKSDDTIEYKGFHINIDIENGSPNNMIPDSCNKTFTANRGMINSKELNDDCTKYTATRNLDATWTIITPETTKIYLNFTAYYLSKPNECEKNLIEVYGYQLEYDHNLAHYCGSVANSVITKGNANGEFGNIMYIRMYATMEAKESAFNATYTAFWPMDPKQEQCPEGKFSCEDNYCIDMELKCDGYGDCRLKTDEDGDRCKGETKSVISEPHIMIILVIFSLILSGMCFVFLFKCSRKLYQDHKIIKEHIKQSTEDRLDTIMEVSNRLTTLDAKKLDRDSGSGSGEQRASLERDNHTNEMYNKQHRKLSQHRKPSSIDSDFIPETHLDLDEEQPWRRDVDSVPIEAQDIRIERNGRVRRSDTSKREESLKSKTKDAEDKERKEIRDVSVGAPDTKESGCQTRESLFQTDPAPSSDGSGTNSRGLSTFGYSGGTIVRPSPPPTKTTELTIELLRQVPPETKSQKKLSERRPMSAETTRSAPDVIIVSKPIR